MRPSSLLEQKNNNWHIEDNLKIWLSYFNTCKWFRLGFLCEFSLRGWFRSGWDLGLLEQVPLSAPHFWERSILTSVPPYLSLLETLNPPPLQPLLVQHTNLIPRVFIPLEQWSENESSGSNHFAITVEITEFCPSSFTAQSASMAHAWNGCSQSSHFPTAGQGKQRLWEQDWQHTETTWTLVLKLKAYHSL